ncbi:uncharacterized protein LACBIDRAFT_314918 [Laccaria bicolor S238N-H82]|uniref:Predicted protein n=1 Tax=Laccaria bicolor (strain S238N-H82 / ATCC MYA-4686) TaxID=486041 RepID=B0DZG1_LACBS|nr:uncharacterized protein LACBIDRAFT_314918 [Laccaria bicolor S238N-H82]EDR00010.1 predicted protein [Laccaria bicolor S238N-H82]|eukprot:XP_001889319.1 predicted protein [Laccaria bicolor S238N-H82]
MVVTLEKSGYEEPKDGQIFNAYRPLIAQLRKRFILRGFIDFLEHSWADGVIRSRSDQRLPIGWSVDTFQDVMNLYCWRLCEAEVCVGIACEDQEFILADCCFGSLDEGFDEDPECCDLFFPVFPTLALYILGTANEQCSSTSTHRQTGRSTIWIDVGLESASDVHLRNAMILQTYPHFLYFSSLRTVALSISSYDEFRWIQEHQDYRSVILTDLTDEVVKGDAAVAHGTFSDVWKGTWNDPIESRPRPVAIKVLRQVMVQNVREKLIKRLQSEVIAWHRLCHRNVSQLFGIVHLSQSIGMVSPWCEHGTLCNYLEHFPSVNRLRLLAQVASAIAYLHTFRPTIVHGDLNGGNILVDERGYAIITDFGLSKVIEEMSETISKGTSFFAGSTRWMAPELIMALVEDDGQIPPITTFSDVYAFASVCLKVATGQLPYPHRTNDHAVTVDIIRGVKPTRGACCLVQVKNVDVFWDTILWIAVGTPLITSALACVRCSRYWMKWIQSDDLLPHRPCSTVS